MTRSRGRRRKGRRTSTSASSSIIEGSNRTRRDTIPTATDVPGDDGHDDDDDAKDARSDHRSDKEDDSGGAKDSGDPHDDTCPTDGGGGRRRCLGRRPVTQFEVGRRYDGKVVYVKSFGAFIDVGCHTDGFCHVSRVRDNYVQDIHDVLKVGDEVRPKVVEIVKEKKRITLSLQTDARTADEMKSIQERNARRSKRRLKAALKESRAGSHPSTDEQTNSAQPLKDRTPPSNETSLRADADADATTNERRTKRINEADITPTSNLKWMRKLLRRAKRRKKKEETGIAA